jgi:hypothetical protein
VDHVFLDFRELNLGPRDRRIGAAGGFEQAPAHLVVGEKTRR